MDRLALVCEEIARRASRQRKISILADYFAALDEDELKLAVQFLSAGPAAEESLNQTLFSVPETRKLAVGHSILREALQVATGWDWETLKICYAEVGDSGETAGLLVRNITRGESLTLSEANLIYQQLYRARTTARKRELLVDVYRTYKPLTVKYFIKMITRGLRIGLMGKMVEEAVAKASGMCPDAIREANNRLGDLAHIAVAARRGELSEIQTRLFHPMEFMLARPLERLEDLASPEEWIIEDKYDGIRSQVHFDSGRVQIYSRGMEDITGAFPEIVEAFARVAGSGLIDGEILAWREGRALNFNILQQRIARKSVRETLKAEIPVLFIAYDILFRNGELLLDRPMEERRRHLQELPLEISAQHEISTGDQIEQLFEEARLRGNEGLLLKRRGSVYEPGKRSGAWLKLKRPYGTLDVVITSAEQGSGRRATVFSDYTFAVRNGTGFVNIGKAYSGLTDSEVKTLTKLLTAASTDRFGPVMVVRPEIVLEVAFDGVQKSSRHKSGYALRFPRILRWRRDKRPEDCDDLARVEALYRASIQ